KLAAAKRPKVLSTWLRSKSKPNDVPSQISVEDLSVELRRWWISLMPDWRIGAKPAEPDAVWPLSRRTPPLESWKKVKKAGPQGIVLVLYGLALW
ncbi:hypothetical protein SCHPADRAFT_810340, partial [Schizopora paradoxa]